MLRPTLALFRQYDIEFAPGATREAEGEFRNMLMSSGYLPKKDPLARVAILLSYIPTQSCCAQPCRRYGEVAVALLPHGQHAELCRCVGEPQARAGDGVLSLSRRALCEPALGPGVV